MNSFMGRDYFRPVMLIKIIILFRSILIIFYLLNANFIITSTVSYTYQPGAANGLVQPANPSSIVRSADVTTRWLLNANDLEINSIFPRIVDRIRFRTELNQGNQSYIDLRTVGNYNTGNHTTLIHSQTLNELTWNKITNGRLTVWQRVNEETAAESTTATKKAPVRPEPRKFISYEDFVSQATIDERVASIGLDPMTMVRVKDYKPAGSSITLTSAFRGSHLMYVYADNEDLNFSFDKIDLNWKGGKDALQMNVARAEDYTERNRQLIKHLTIADDGSTKLSQPKKFEVSIKNAKNGWYRVAFETTDDILIKNFTINKSLFGFYHNLMIAGGPAYSKGGVFTPLNLITSASTTAIQTWHEPAKQQIKVGNQTINLKQLKKESKVENLSGQTKIEIPRDDVIITSDGFITWDGATLPPSTGTTPVDIATIPSLSEFDYLIADYQPTTEKKEISIDQEYELSQLAVGKNKTVSFTIHAPGLRENNAQLGIKKIQVTLTRGPLTIAQVWNKLKKIF